mmetsp:Transcript_82415/g.123685  ORF Transcript_82415/g.123685 Transcript_82415/m.123685 type:complete len:1250 (+) Transcript_82415:147-3896(+)
MGSETSKPAEETPEDWQHGNSFQMISPRSDLSNPSDIHRIHRHHVAVATALTERNRRVSKTITKTMPEQNLQRKLPPPQALYFPTIETERESDRISKEASENKENGRPKRNLRKIFGGCFAEGAAQIEMERLENGEQTDNVKKATVFHTNGPEEKTNKASRKKKNSKGHRISDFDVKESAPLAEMMPINESRKGDGRRSNQSSNQRSRKEDTRRSKDESGLQKALSSTVHSFVIREAEDVVVPHDSALGIAQLALHQEEDYFARLTAGPGRYGQVQDSPVVQENEALNHLPSALGNVETMKNPDSPISNLFATVAEETDDSPEIEETAGAAISPEGAEIQQNVSVAPTTMTGASELAGNSVVGCLQKFHTQIRLNSAPEMSTDEEDKSVKVFLDETHDSSEQDTTKEVSTEQPSEEEDEVSSSPSDAVLHLSSFAQGSKVNEVVAEDELVEKVEPASEGAIEEGSDEDSAILSYFRPAEVNTATAFRPREVVPDEPLKQIATLGPNSKGDDISKKSKLASLFRPVLPSLSVDDAASATSYDPYEIKVTESAPSAIESRDYRALALRPNYGSPESSAGAMSRQLGAFSPSMMSIDSQVDQSPARTQVMVSDQALFNAEFLFSSDYKVTQKRLQNDRDSAMFSISTLGARSRTSQRSTRVKPVKIPVKGTMGYISDADDETSSRSSNSERRVRFSETSSSSNPSSSQNNEDGIDMALIERKVSDLTDSASEAGSRESIKKLQNREFKTQTEKFMADDKSSGPEPAIHWEYTTKDGVTAVTPHRKGNSLKNATNSPYLRYQAAKSNYETAARRDVAQDTIEIPVIESKVSDLTESLSDFGGRLSHGSARSATMEETIPEESEFDGAESTSSSASPPKLNWSYSEKDGVISAVTPHLKGRSLKNATNSPFLRFKNAKNTFGTKSKESLPIKSPRTSKTRKSGSSKSGKRTSGGVVSSRIEALNRKVRETRKMRRLSRRTAGNPRVHAPVETNVIRTQAIMTYRTDMVGIEKRNYMGAAKFNRIPIDDDQSVGSSSSEDSVEYDNSPSVPTGIHDDSRVYPTESIDEYREESVDKDDASGMTEDKDDISRLSQDDPTVATVPTVRQSHVPTASDIYSDPSEGRLSTSSQSFSNVRRQVFRGYDSIGTQARQSMASNGESTTLSSIILKENSSHTFRSGVNAVKPSQQAIATTPGALHLSPPQRTPMEARKWRTLAAAAKEKDALKRAHKTGGKPAAGLRARKGLSERNVNTIAI